MKKLLTGNEALVRGAYEAGVLFASAYPGTPSSEILANMATYEGVNAEWAPNEKVALEAAIGASIAGVRAIAAMKHVGLNVAADPLFTYAYTGVNGGLVLINADEPGQHSSQNEQDNRNYAKAARVPMLEPSTSQEAKDMIAEAFDISETFDAPVMIRMTTRGCHSKGIVDCLERKAPTPKKYEKNVRKFVTVPAIARMLRANLEVKTAKLKEFSEKTPLNRIEDNGKKTGVIVSGVAYCFAKEVFGDDVNYLKLGFTWPLPDDLISKFCKSMDKIYIIEENDPYLEDTVKRLGFDCLGKNTFPAFGELTPDVIRKSVFGETCEGIVYEGDKVVDRPPVLCAGCPHRGLYYELGKRKNVLCSGDIGCYTLGFAPPYESMDTTICMGASISIGHGAQKAFDMIKSDTRVVSLIGDSTFFHTGINSLLDVMYNGGRTVNIILDNRTTGMTGHQDHPGTGRRIDGSDAPMVDIETLVRAMGVKHVAVINPNDLKKVRETLDWALALDEPSVIVTKWPCLLKRFTEEDKKEFPGAFTGSAAVDPDKCISCKLCLRCGCPSLSIDRESGKSSIDGPRCVGCGVCVQVCPKQAIALIEGGAK